MNDFKIVSIVPATADWFAIMVDTRRLDDPSAPITMKLPIACWALAEGTESVKPAQEGGAIEKHLVQRVIPLASFGPMLNNPTDMPDYLGMIGPDSKTGIIEFVGAAQKRRARLLKKRDGAVQKVADIEAALEVVGQTVEGPEDGGGD